MRIVYVSWEYPPQFGGGIGTYVHGAAGALAQRGHDVTVVTVSPDACPRRAIEQGVHVVRLPVWGEPGDGPAASLRNWQGRADSVAALLRRLSAAGAVDLIEFADYRGEGFTFLTETAPAERPVSVVRLHTSLHVLYKYNAGHARYAVLEEFEGQAILAADRVGSPSQALAREMRSALPEMRAVDITPYPCDPTFLAYDTAAVAPRGEALYVGRFEERKGVVALIRAAERFLDACPDLTLVMIGGDTRRSAAEPSMKRIVRDLIPPRLAERVELLEPMPREQLIERYAAARFCVFPSLFENFPNTCLEAMSLGKCVIGTDNSGMAEMIEPGVSGLIARAGDADDLAEHMIRLGRMTAAEREAMGAAARQRMRERYHPEVIGREMERLYSGYVASHARAAGTATRPSASPATTRGEGGDHGFGQRPAGRVGRRPRVAVVIPCYNHGHYLAETLESVRAQIYPHVECVVVDDGSTEARTCDVLDAIARAGVVRVIRQENQGLAAARNTGVRATDAPFFVPLDADDRLHPQFIERLLAPLLRDATLGYAYSHVQFFDAASGVWECPAYAPERLAVENLSVATALVRREAWELAGGYQPDMVHGFEDWDFWLALLSLGYHGHCVPEPLFCYRKHKADSMLAHTQRHRGEMLATIIGHHQRLFMGLLTPALVRKDEMFFRAHMEAWEARRADGPRSALITQLTRERDEAWREAQRVGRGWEQQRDYIAEIETELARLRARGNGAPASGGLRRAARRLGLGGLLARLRSKS